MLLEFPVADSSEESQTYDAMLIEALSQLINGEPGIKLPKPDLPNLRRHRSRHSRKKAGLPTEFLKNALNYLIHRHDHKTDTDGTHADRQNRVQGRLFVFGL